jgi:hypothetical protein
MVTNHELSQGEKMKEKGLAHLTEEQVLRCIEELENLPGMKDPYPLWGKIIALLAFITTSAFAAGSILGSVIDDAHKFHATLNEIFRPLVPFVMIVGIAMIFAGGFALMRSGENALRYTWGLFVLLALAAAPILIVSRVEVLDFLVQNFSLLSSMAKISSLTVLILAVLRFIDLRMVYPIALMGLLGWAFNFIPLT